MGLNGNGLRKIMSSCSCAGAGSGRSSVAWLGTASVCKLFSFPSYVRSISLKYGSLEQCDDPQKWILCWKGGERAQLFLLLKLKEGSAQMSSKFT
jgi:hypothetical protein